MMTVQKEYVHFFLLHKCLSVNRALLVDDTFSFAGLMHACDLGVLHALCYDLVCDWVLFIVCEGVGWVEIRTSVSTVKFGKFVPINYHPLVFGDIHRPFGSTLMSLEELSTMVTSF